MSLKEFQKEWKKIASELELDIELNFPIQTEHSSFIAPVLLKNFGANNGLILLTNYDAIKSFSDELIEKGYGFSTLSESIGNEQFDTKSIIDMLKDWGWSAQEPPPHWYKSVST